MLIKLKCIKLTKKIEERCWKLGRTITVWERKRTEERGTRFKLLRGAEARLLNMAAWSVTSCSGGNCDRSRCALIAFSSILISLLFSCFRPSSLLLFPLTVLHSYTAYGHLLTTLTVLTGKHSPGLNAAFKTLTSACPIYQDLTICSFG